MSNLYRENEIGEKQWGHYKVLCTGALFTCKVLLIRPHKSISLQTHQYRSEHWTICSGIATVQLDDRIFEVGANKHIFIAPKQLHCLANNTGEDLVVNEVQYGHYLAETDIVRYQYVAQWPIQQIVR